MTTFQATWASGIVIRWRLLTWSEHRKFSEKFKTNNPMSVCNDIYRICVLQGPKLDEVTAGIVEFLALYCYENSAFTGTLDTIQSKQRSARERVSTDFLQMAKATIAHLFRYSLEEIDTWDDETFMARFSMAEVILGKQMDPVSVQATEESPTKAPKRPLNPTQAEVVRRHYTGK